MAAEQLSGPSADPHVVGQRALGATGGRRRVDAPLRSAPAVRVLDQDLRAIGHVQRERRGGDRFGEHQVVDSVSVRYVESPYINGSGTARRGRTTGRRAVAAPSRPTRRGCCAGPRPRLRGSCPAPGELWFVSMSGAHLVQPFRLLSHTGLLVRPPSATISAPLTNDASVEARNSTTRAISSGSANRPSGFDRA